MCRHFYVTISYTLYFSSDTFFRKFRKSACLPYAIRKSSYIRSFSQVYPKAILGTFVNRAPAWHNQNQQAVNNDTNLTSAVHFVNYCLWNMH